MKRQRSHYKLSAIKAAFSQPAQLNRTMTATHGAESMDIDEQAVADVISSLSSRDFDKSMRADLKPDDLAGCLQANCQRPGAVREVYARCPRKAVFD
jgi:hypothetical protein